MIKSELIAKLAEEVQLLLSQGPPVGKSDPDAVLCQQVTSLDGPLLGKLDFARLAADSRAAGAGAPNPDEPSAPFGLPGAPFHSPKTIGCPLVSISSASTPIARKSSRTNSA